MFSLVKYIFLVDTTFSCFTDWSQLEVASPPLTSRDPFFNLFEGVIQCYLAIPEETFSGSTYSALNIASSVTIIPKDEFIVSRIYRMPIYRTFSYIEEYITAVRALV